MPDLVARWLLNLGAFIAVTCIVLTIAGWCRARRATAAKAETLRLLKRDVLDKESNHL